VRMRERVLRRMAPQQHGDGLQLDIGTALPDAHAPAAAQLIVGPQARMRQYTCAHGFCY